MDKANEVGLRACFEALARLQSKRFDLLKAIESPGTSPVQRLRLRARERALFEERAPIGAQFYGHVHPIISAQVDRLLSGRPPQDVEDVLGDAMYRVCRSICQQRGETDAEARAWVRRIAVNTAYDYLRRVYRCVEDSSSTIDSHPGHADREGDTSRHVDAERAFDRGFEEALAATSAIYRTGEPAALRERLRKEKITRNAARRRYYAELATDRHWRGLGTLQIAAQRHGFDPSAANARAIKAARDLVDQQCRRGRVLLVVGANVSAPPWDDGPLGFPTLLVLHTFKTQRERSGERRGSIGGEEMTGALLEQRGLVQRLRRELAEALEDLKSEDPTRSGSAEQRLVAVLNERDRLQHWMDGGRGVGQAPLPPELDQPVAALDDELDACAEDLATLPWCPMDEVGANSAWRRVPEPVSLEPEGADTPPRPRRDASRRISKFPPVRVAKDAGGEITARSSEIPSRYTARPPRADRVVYDFLEGGALYAERDGEQLYVTLQTESAEVEASIAGVTLQASDQGRLTTRVSAEQRALNVVIQGQAYRFILRGLGATQTPEALVRAPDGPQRDAVQAIWRQLSGALYPLPTPTIVAAGPDTTLSWREGCSEFQLQIAEDGGWCWRCQHEIGDAPGRAEGAGDGDLPEGAVELLAWVLGT